MNGVPDYYDVRVTQSAKGVWSCDKLEYSSKEWPEVLTTLDLAMSDVEELLRKHNNPAEAPATHTARTIEAMDKARKSVSSKADKEGK